MDAGTEDQDYEPDEDTLEHLRLQEIEHADDFSSPYQPDPKEIDELLDEEAVERMSPEAATKLVTAWVKSIDHPPYVIPLSLDGKEMLCFQRPTPPARSGWAAYFWDDGQQSPLLASIFVRIGPTPMDDPTVEEKWLQFDVPLEIREVHVMADRQGEISGAFLRKIPFDRIEAAVNIPAHRKALSALVVPIMIGQPPGAVAQPSERPADADGNFAPPDESAWLLRPEPSKPSAHSLRLDVPEGYRKPDEFYAKVAFLYLWQASMSTRPAQDLAEANDLKTTTVHRWVREAKTRGLLVLPGRGDPQPARTRRGDPKPSEADRLVAQEINAAPKEIAVIAHKLWGRTVTEERDRRLSELERKTDLPLRSMASARWKMTQRLAQEIATKVNEGLDLIDPPDDGWPSTADDVWSSAEVPF